jgi:hypothetical protein
MNRVEDVHAVEEEVGQDRGEDVGDDAHAGDADPLCPPPLPEERSLAPPDVVGEEEGQPEGDEQGVKRRAVRPGQIDPDEGVEIGDDDRREHHGEGGSVVILVEEGRRDQRADREVDDRRGHADPSGRPPDSVVVRQPSKGRFDSLFAAGGVSGPCPGPTRAAISPNTSPGK